MHIAYLTPLVAAVLAAGTMFGAQAATPVRAVAATATSATSNLAATVAAMKLGTATDLGPVPDSKVDFSVVLPYRHPNDLATLIALQRTPGSKYFRRFLKPVEFRGYFSPTQATYTAAAVALQKAGFKVETFANRTVLHASGKAAAAERYFATSIHAVRQPDGRIGYANVAPATIPAALAGSRVVGLNGIITAHSAVSRHTPAVRPNVSGGPLFGPDGGFGPLAIAKAEDFPVEHGYTGKNSNVADIIDGTVADSDIATFLQTFGEKRSGPRTTSIAVDGGCGQFCFDSFSATIDAEWALGMAPGASLFIYQLPSLSNGGIVDGFNAVASDDAVNVVNFAVAACEIDGADLQLALTPIIAQGAAEGITYESIAFGGANTCNVPPLNLPVTPANLDTVTAVGASSTFVDQTGKQLSESGFVGSNGGVSIVVPLPAWQAKTSGINPSGRNVPDVVIPGDVDGVGPSVYFAGTWQGGFAFVNNAPFAGYLATVQEMFGYTTPLGNVAPAMYATFDKYGYTASGTPLFTDVTLGCIGAVAGVPVCAKSGYDVASGIGSIAGGFALAKSFGFGPIAPPTP